MQGDCLPQRHTGLPRPPPIPGAQRRCRGIACRSGTPDYPDHHRSRERSDDAGGSADIRRSGLITAGNPPGSLRSPVPLERGTDAARSSVRSSREPVLRSPLQGSQFFGPPCKGSQFSVPLSRGTAEERSDDAGGLLAAAAHRTYPRPPPIPGAKRRCRGIGRHSKIRADHGRQSPWLTAFARPP